MELYGQTIGKVYHIKDGEGEYGVWRMWSFYLDGVKDKRFTYFSGGKKPDPIEGMKIGYMKYTTKQDGEYTNRTIDELKVSQESSEPQLDTPQDTSMHRQFPPAPSRDDTVFGQCKYGFLKEAFVSYLRGKFPVDYIDTIEETAEEFTVMAMRRLPPEPIDTFKDAPDGESPFPDEEIPLDSYERDV